MKTPWIAAVLNYFLLARRWTTESTRITPHKPQAGRIRADERTSASIWLIPTVLSAAENTVNGFAEPLPR